MWRVDRSIACFPRKDGAGTGVGDFRWLQISLWTFVSLADSAQVADPLVDVHDPIFGLIVASDSVMDRVTAGILLFRKV